MEEAARRVLAPPPHPVSAGVGLAAGAGVPQPVLGAAVAQPVAVVGDDAGLVLGGRHILPILVLHAMMKSCKKYTEFIGC